MRGPLTLAESCLTAPRPDGANSADATVATVYRIELMIRFERGKGVGSRESFFDSDYAERAARSELVTLFPSVDRLEMGDTGANFRPAEEGTKGGPSLKTKVKAYHRLAWREA